MAEKIALEAGIEGTKEIVVSEEISARTMGSGELAVLATPEMVALVEEAAWRSVAPALEEDQGSVGTAMTLEHSAPTPLGMRVVAHTTLVKVDGRRLVFEWECSDESGQVGKGTHERFVIFSERFQQKADAKLS